MSDMVLSSRIMLSWQRSSPVRGLVEALKRKHHFRDVRKLHQIFSCAKRGCSTYGKSSKGGTKIVPPSRTKQKRGDVKHKLMCHASNPRYWSLM